MIENIYNNQNLIVAVHQKNWNHIANYFYVSKSYWKEKVYGLHAEHDFEDIYQDAIIHLLQKIKQGKFSSEKGSLKTWIGTGIINFFIDNKRKSSNRFIADNFQYESDLKKKFRYLEQDDYQSKKDNQDALKREVKIRTKVLNFKELQVLDLLFYQEKKYSEISKELNLKEGTVKGMIFKLKEKMRLVK